MENSLEAAIKATLQSKPGITNRVLVEQRQNETIYYLPCYIRLKVKSVKQLAIDSLSGIISGTLLFSFYYGDLPNDILEQFTKRENKAILLQLSRQEAIQLKESKEIVCKQQPDLKIIEYVVRTEFNCNLQGQVFFTPFEILDLRLKVTVNTLIVNPRQKDQKRICIKFNCMNSQIVTCIDSTKNLEFGNYCLANHYLNTAYTNSSSYPFPPISGLESDSIETQKKSQSGMKSSMNAEIEDGELSVQNLLEAMYLNTAKSFKEEKVQNFQYAHFRIPLYKVPGSSLFSIFVPLWVIAFINLVIFFQDNRLADRMAVIATVSLAFIAFLPTINDKIPQKKTVSFVEILIYIQTGLTLLTMIDSLIVRFEYKYDDGYLMNWRQNGFFLTALIINILIIATVITLYVLHKLWWEKDYNKERKRTFIPKKFLPQLWSNKECDEYFEQLLSSKTISQLETDSITIKVEPESEK